MPVLVRPATVSDVGVVTRMVHDLAAHEEAADECLLTEEQLTAALFGEAPALYGHVAESDGAVVGFALWYLSFSTWEGVHGVYIEDTYVAPSARGAGVARALFGELAALCEERGYARIEGWSLDWNEGINAFNRATGARPMSEWTVYRWSGPALAGLASARSGLR